MALVSLANVNPYAVDRSANIQAAGALGRGIGQVAQSLGQGYAAAKAKAEEEAKKLAKEQAEKNKKLSTNLSESFGSLNDSLENNNFLQESFITNGRETMKEYTALYRQLEDNPDLSEDEISSITAKMDSLKSRGENMSAALDNLNATTASIRAMAEKGEISPGTDPSIVSFVTEMDDPELQKNYTIEKDDEGNQFIVGTTQEGKDIRLSVDKLATKENQLRVLPNKPLSDFTSAITEQVLENPIMKVGVNQIGAVQHIDAAETGKITGQVAMNVLADETSFRQIASGYGFGFDKIASLSGEGGAITEGIDEAGENGPNKGVDLSDGINSPEELKGYLANMMVLDVAQDPRITGYSKQLNTSIQTREQQTLLARQKADIKKQEKIDLETEKVEKKNEALISKLGTIESITKLDEGEIGSLKNYEQHKATNGQIITNFARQGNKVVMTFKGHTSEKPVAETFDIGTQEGRAALAALLPDDPTTQYSEAILSRSSQFEVK